MPLVNVNVEGTADKLARFDFDVVADKYDKWYETAEGAMYDRLEKKAVSRYLRQNVQGMKLLEVGCGTGHWSQFFSDCGFEVTGVDISEPMIKVAQGKNIPNALFRIADGHFLPFEDNSFDVTAAITTLEFAGNAELVLQEMVRCTRKPSGQLLIGVLNALARLNRNRQQTPESLYAKARLFSTVQIKKLLQSHGQAHVVTAGFIPRQKLFLPLSPFIDAIGRFLHLPYGVFIAGQVRL
ncbi:MAG: class I SAM-dependent methyltransferase [Sedimentisphaerales bacterium]